MNILFRRTATVLIVATAVIPLAGSIYQAQIPNSEPPATVPGPLIVFLGTGMPRPDPDREGPSLAIVVGDKAYIVDAGVGLVRQAEAAYDRGISALAKDHLDTLFLTHLHSDHTLGLPDLILTPWVMGRTEPLEVYGPVGTQAMADNIEKAYAEDIQIRTTNGLEHLNMTGYKVLVHEIQPGVVYKDANVNVTAFLVLHGSWKEALGYRFVAGGKSIVISGDTRPAESVVQACDGCDVLIHEVYTGTAAQPPAAYFASFHTSAAELAQIAARARPKLLVIWHYVPRGNSNQTQMVGEIQAAFHGPIVVARDLDVIAP